MKSRLKAHILFATLMALSFSLNAGWFFDDPVEMSLTWKPNLFSKDQVSFAPSGKHEDLFLLGAYYTIEVAYSDHTTVINSDQNFVSSTKPLVVTLPNDIKGILSVSLKAKWRKTVVLIGRVKKGAHFSEHTTPAEWTKNTEILKGLKVDTTWSIRQ